MKRAVSAQALLAGLLVLLSLLLVGWRLTREGLLDGDDFVYFRSAVADLTTIKWMLAGKSYSLAEALKATGVFPESNWYCKPLWHILTMLALVAGGISQASILWASALLFVATGPVVYLLARRLAGPRAAVWALLWFVSSPILLRYARSGLAHMPQLFFFSLGAYYYLVDGQDPKRFRGLWFCGLFMGLALASHMSALPYVGLVFVHEAWAFLFKKSDGRKWLIRSLSLALPIFMVGGVMELLHLYFRQAMGPEGRALLSSGYGPYMTYWEQIKFNFMGTQHYGDVATRVPVTTVIGSAAHLTKFLDRLRAYLYDPWIYDGSMRLLAGAAALLLALKKDSRLAAIALWASIPYLFFFSWGNPDLRTVLTSFLLTAVPAGVLLSELWGRLGSGLGAKAAAAAVLFLFIGNLTPLYRTHSGFLEAANWLKSRRVDQVLVLDTGVHGDSFMAVSGVPTSLVEARDIGSQRVPYILVSTRDSFFNPARKIETADFARKLLSRKQPVFQDVFLPAQHSCDSARRRNSPVVDRLLVHFLGRNFQRSPMPVAIYETPVAAEFYKRLSYGS